MCSPRRRIACSHRRRVIPIDFEATVERTILDWRQRYILRQVLFDPFQMASTAQRLAKALVPIEEYPQTVPNLTAATQNLFDLIQSRQLVLYPDAAMRLAVQRAIITESSRGWRLDKLKQHHQIDVVVALQHGGARRGARAGEARLRLVCARLVRRRHDADDKQAGDERYRRELGAHIYACTGIWPR